MREGNYYTQKKVMKDVERAVGRRRDIHGRSDCMVGGGERTVDRWPEAHGQTQRKERTAHEIIWREGWLVFTATCIKQSNIKVQLPVPIASKS